MVCIMGLIGNLVSAAVLSRDSKSCPECQKPEVTSDENLIMKIRNTDKQACISAVKK